MKKRSLGLLLALVLALSPVFGAVSFADEEECQHWDAYEEVDRSGANYEFESIRYHHVTGVEKRVLYCPDCETELEVNEYDLDEIEGHSYDENGVCTLCGYVNECSHENTTTYYYSVSDVTYTSVDDRIHKMTGPMGSIRKYVQCDDCDMTLGEEDAAEGVENHAYNEEGVCDLCGHENTCEHLNLEEPYLWPESEDYESIDDVYHHYTANGCMKGWCPDCETWVITDPDAEIDRTENHSYDDEGVCYDCGHKNECPHENMDEPELAWYENDVSFDSIDDENHRITGVGFMRAYCPDCQAWIITERDVEVNKTQRHSYQDGECIFCNHKNPCKHPDLQGPFTDFWYKEDLEYTSVDDHYHRATGPGYTYTYCPDCGERNIIDNDVEYDELQEHYYQDGVCIDCGHENECTHPHTVNPHIQYNYDDVTITPIDNLYHHITGTGFMVSYCPDCGSSVVGEEAEVDEKEKHWYWQGECEICGHHLHVDEQVSRIYGADRYTTSRKVADELKEKLNKDKFDAVILANGKNYPDALAGSYLSCQAEAPILLVDSRQDHINDVQMYINANLNEGGTIYMLGGSAVVPDKAVAGLSGYKVKRLGGQDRYETNIKILEEAATYGTDYEMIVCTGKDFADSLSAAAVGRPILLVGKSLSKAQKEYLKSLNNSYLFCIIGGEGAVSKDIQKTLQNDYGGAWRIAGKDRYETSVNVARAFFNEPIAGVLAYGANFPDGLCGGALAAAVNGPLILTTSGKTAAAKQYAAEQNAHFGYVLGGETLINDKAARDIFRLAPSDKIIVK